MAAGGGCVDGVEGAPETSGLAAVSGCGGVTLPGADTKLGILTLVHGLFQINYHECIFFKHSCYASM
jgi:hypothetical protein